MSNWKLSAIASGVKAVLPFQGVMRSFTRRLRPYETNPQNDIGLLGDALRQIEALRKAGKELHGSTVVEIGTGWKPILPIMFRLCGARRVVTVDQERLLDLNQFQSALTYIQQNLEFVSKKTQIFVEASFNQISVDSSSLSKTLAASGIDYLAPFNFLDLPSGSADVIISRTVLEHIPEKLLNAIMDESARILIPGGVICHTIDMSDHWEHVDKSISRVNFLKYDGIGWKLTGINPQNFQNRLRQFEYIKLIQRNGFDILTVSGEPNQAALSALKSLNLCERYQNIAHEQLAILVTTIVARNVKRERPLEKSE